MNFGGSTLLGGHADNWRIGFGDGNSITGLAGALILLLLFTASFVASALWAARRSRVNGSAPPLAADLLEQRDKPAATKDVDGLRLSASHLY